MGRACRKLTYDFHHSEREWACSAGFPDLVHMRTILSWRYESCRSGDLGPRRPALAKQPSSEVAASCDTLRAAGLREQLMIDVSHGNSGKQHQRQVPVAHDVAGPHAEAAGSAAMGRQSA